MFRGDQRRDFQPRLDAQATSTRRVNSRLELRKAKKERENREKRKKLPENVSNMTSQWDDLSQLDPQTQERLRNLNKMAQLLRSGTAQQKEETVEQVRKLLSIEKTPPIQSVINAGIVADLMKLLKDTSNSMKLRFEAAWALTNVASGSSQHTKVVVDNGGVETFVKILAQEDGDIKEQAVWAVGNIAGDSAELRDRVLRADALSYLIQIFKDHQQNLGLLRNATWTLSNFCRGKPHADFCFLKPCLPLLVSLLQVEDDEILVDTCWAISYISDDPTSTNSRIQEVINFGFVPHLIRLLSHRSPLVVHPALRAIGNIVTGNDDQTQRVIENGVLSKLKLLLSNEKVGIRKEACWTISNITAGNVTQIEAVIRAHLMQPVLKHLSSAVFEISKEACWAVSNATAGGNHEQIKYLCHLGCIRPLINIIEFSNPKTIRVALEGIENILKSGSEENPNPFVSQIEEVGGFNIIGALDNGLNENIREKIQRIMMHDPSRKKGANKLINNSRPGPQIVTNNNNNNNPGNFNFQNNQTQQNNTNNNNNLFQNQQNTGMNNNPNNNNNFFNNTTSNNNNNQNQNNQNNQNSLFAGNNAAVNSLFGNVQLGSDQTQL